MGETAKYSNVHYTGNSAFAIGNDMIGEPRSEFCRRRRRCRPWVVFVILLILALILALAAFALLYFSTKIELCKSEECLRIAASLKESMNTAVDPCDDFYEFACGRWQNHHTQMCPTRLSDHEYSWFKERKDVMSRKLKDLIRKKPKAKETNAIEQTRLLYKSCVDTASWEAHGLKPIKSLLKNLGVPEIPPILTQKPANFVIQLARLKKFLGSDLFFGSSIMQDPRNHTRNIIAFDAPDLRTPFPNKLDKQEMKVLEQKLRNSSGGKGEAENSTFSLLFKNATETYMFELARYILSNGTVNGDSCNSSQVYNGINDQQIREAVKRIYEFDRAFKELTDLYKSSTPTIKSLAESNYRTLAELQADMEEFVSSQDKNLKPLEIWQPFMAEVFKGVSEDFFESDETYLVKNMDYLKNVSLLMAKTDPTVLESFLWWTVVDYYTPFAPKGVKDLRENYLSKLSIGGNSCQRSVLCADQVTELFGMAVSRLYVESNLDHREKSKKLSTLGAEPQTSTSGAVQDDRFVRVGEMLDNIGSSFLQIVEEANWMDNPTKAATLEKQAKMVTLIGYPKWIFNDTELNRMHPKVELDDSYFDNVNKIMKASLSETLQNYVKNEINGSKNLDDEEDDDEEDDTWPISPTEVNAIYLPQTNQITVPIGMLQFPFYELGLEALNYGAVGSIIGHEVTHGFDNSGRLLDSNGSLKEWWSNETSEQYEKIADCFIEQYDQIYEAEVEESVDGEKTLDENIADNGGLRQVYNAYQLWKKKHGTEPYLPGFTDFSHEQLLFLGYAHMWCESYTTLGLKWMLDDEHSPRHVRVRAVLANSKQFSDTWKCPVGSNMNPEKKCQLW